MKRTQFAGLTALEQGESIYTDGGSFLERNPQIIDRLLQIGAVSHRHDEAAALASPIAEPTVTPLADGGALPPNTAIYVGYTLIDDRGGETAISPLVDVLTPAPLPTPTLAPTLAVDYTAGALRADSYFYVVTVTDGQGGETPAGPQASIIREPGHDDGRVVISGLDAIVAASGGAGWRIYRAAAGGSWGYLVEGTTATFTDDGIDCVDCNVQPPQTFDNTTRSANRLQIELPSIPAGATAVRIYAGPSASLLSPSLVTELAPANFADDVFLEDWLFYPGSPPPVSTAHGGASKIDANTEIRNLSWKAPVADVASLPAGDKGDLRVTLDTLDLWVRDTGGWVGPIGRMAIRDDAGGLVLARAAGLRFDGAGRATLTVTDNGDKTATVLIDVPALSVSDAEDTLASPDGIEFVAGDGIAIGVTDVGGVARVQITNLGGGGGGGGGGIRGTVSHTTVALATGAGENFTVDLGSLSVIERIATDRPARVRLYVTPTKRDDDISRPMTDDPRGPDLSEPINHGLIVELITRTGELSWPLSPAPTAADLKAVPDGEIAGRVENFDGATGTVTVTFTRTPLE